MILTAYHRYSPGSSDFSAWVLTNPGNWYQRRSFSLQDKSSIPECLVMRRKGVFLGRVLVNSKERTTSAWVPAVLSWLMILASLIRLFRCIQDTQAVNYPHPMTKMEKSDYQRMASIILTLILGRESLADLVERLWAICSRKRKGHQRPKCWWIRRIIRRSYRRPVRFNWNSRGKLLESRLVYHNDP